MPYSFLLVSWGSSGNLSPVLTAGRRLRGSGHRVRVMADPMMREEVKGANFEFIAWNRAPIGAEADPANVSDMKAWFQGAMFDPILAYATDIQDEINRVPTDAVLSLDFLFGAVLGAEVDGIPIAMLSPHIFIPPLPGAPPVLSSLKPPKTPEDRAAIAAAAENWTNFWDGFLPSLNSSRARLGLPGLAHVLDIYDRADRVLLAIGRAFDFEADSFPDNLRYVGPLLDEPGWAKPWQAPWQAGSTRPRALIACSTGAQGQGDLVQRVVTATGSVEIEAVVTTGPNLNVADLRAPENVHLLPSAPHDTVMKEVSLVVTQGGHGTVCRSLLNGLPMLVLPNGRDQNDNALRVEVKGAGLQLPPTAPEADIAAAMSRLAREPHFREAARRLGDAIRAEIAASSLVEEMETIAAAGHRRKPIVQDRVQRRSLEEADNP
ncbi:MAG TPA: glycosyltransferase [Acetobacteraceae bacterium]|nr:glycosyltransferase [Acetobacteraceae bacterium]